jgi:NitT/TauT family transport system substrate-binding protein
MGFLRQISQRALLPAAFALFFGAFAAPANAEDLTVIQFSSVGGITDAPLYLAEEYGLFTKAGLKVERQRMTSAPNLMTAVATGQVDAAGISITPGLYSSVQQGVHMRIVGDKQSLSPGISATRLVIRSDLSTGTEAGDMKVLKGKKIAISAKASSVNMLLASLLKKYGMTFADVQVIELSYPNMMPALASKAIDGAIDLEPFMSQALQGGVAKVVSDLTEFVPEHGAVIVPIVYSEDFARKTKLANAFMRAYMQGVRIYNDAMVKGKDTEKAIDIIARYAKVKPEIVRDSFPAGMDPNQRISLPFLEELQTFFVKEKFLRDKIDVNKIVDLSFADAAVKELGTYK